MSPSIWQRVVQANRPGPPEHSVSFRVASATTVLIATAACWHQGELSVPVAAFTMSATAADNVFSFRRRRRPWPPIKPILAVCALGGFAWFIVTATRSATPGDISTVESPLAVLFAWVLSTHAFDVPARRDVAYSAAGSAALMAVAAAQSVDLSLGLFVVPWAASGIWALVAMWRSMANATGVPWRSVAIAGVAVAALAGLIVALVPAPAVSTTLVFPSTSANSAPVTSPNGLTDGSASLPARAASPQGRTGVGGYLGFAKSLDTADRASLGTEVIMRVRATKPTYWIGQTYDTWNGQSWTQASGTGSGSESIRLESGSPFNIPLSTDQVAERSNGSLDIQTFYLAQSGPNLVFHADNAQRVYIQSRSLDLTGGGTIVSATSMGSGTIYTVVSDDTTASASQMEQATEPLLTGGPLVETLPAGLKAATLQLPHPYPRVAALARRITAGIGAPGGVDPRTYQKVEAIEAWMSSHVRYTTDIPPLPAGADSVDSFLFGTRRGYCEQISTATVVMLRSLGIPTREAVGYVPGSYNPITDLYDVEANDAHAWVQVWFPGYGWQNFDPTADVPLANPSPGSVMATWATHTLSGLPWIPLGIGAAVLLAWDQLRRSRRRRPATWSLLIVSDLERGGKRLGSPRRVGETFTAYGHRLASVVPSFGGGVVAAVRLVERSSYGRIEPSHEEIAAVVAFTRRFRTMRRGTGDPGPDQEREWASASSKLAPASSSGR